LILYSLPSIIALAAPFASLVGTLMTIGRMNSDNEVLVMLSSGLSYMNIFLPAVFVGVVISLFSFLANDVLLPAGTVQFSRLYRRILVSTPALELEANSVKRFKDTVIVTGPVTEGRVNDVLILDRTSDGERRVISAAGASLSDQGKEGIVLDLEKAFVQSSGEIVRENYDYASSGMLSYRIPQEDLIQAVATVSPREMSSTDVRREIKIKEAVREERLNERYRMLCAGALALEKSLRGGPENEDWNRRTGLVAAFEREFESIRPVKNDRSLLIHRLEYNKKFSIPFGALSFVFLSVSLGLLAKKSGQTVGFIFGLAIAVLYWALLLGGQNMGLRLGYSPFWTMWLPNIIAISTGIVMAIIRVRK
jgi:lipopolysaccharide export system permease protein